MPPSSIVPSVPSMVMRYEIARTTPLLAALDSPLTFRSLILNEAAPPSSTPKTPRSSHQSVTTGIKVCALAAQTAPTSMPAGRVGVLTWDAHPNPTFNPSLPHNAHTMPKISNTSFSNLVIAQKPDYSPSPIHNLRLPTLSTPQFESRSLATPAEPVLLTPDRVQLEPYLVQGLTQLEAQPQPDLALHLTPHLTSDLAQSRPHLASDLPLHVASRLPQSQPHFAQSVPPLAAQLAAITRTAIASLTTTSISSTLVSAVDRQKSACCRNEVEQQGLH